MTQVESTSYRRTWPWETTTQNRSSGSADKILHLDGFRPLFSHEHIAECYSMSRLFQICRFKLKGYQVGEEEESVGGASRAIISGIQTGISLPERPLSESPCLLIDVCFALTEHSHNGTSCLRVRAAVLDGSSVAIPGTGQRIDLLVTLVKPSCLTKKRESGTSLWG